MFCAIWLMMEQLSCRGLRHFAARPGKTRCDFSASRGHTNVSQSLSKSPTYFPPLSSVYLSLIDSTLFAVWATSDFTNSMCFSYEPLTNA